MYSLSCVRVNLLIVNNRLHLQVIATSQNDCIIVILGRFIVVAILNFREIQVILGVCLLDY